MKKALNSGKIKGTKTVDKKCKKELELLDGKNSVSWNKK